MPACIHSIGKVRVHVVLHMKAALVLDGYNAAMCAQYTLSSSLSLSLYLPLAVFLKAPIVDCLSSSLSVSCSS